LSIVGGALDATSHRYFLSLYSKYKDPGAKITLRIGENVYPTAIADKTLMSYLPYVEYEDLLKNEKEHSANALRARLWIKKMQAGTGSSMTRTTYLSELLNVPKEKIKIGAKGTDLFIEVKDKRYSKIKKYISLAEVQMLQSIVDSLKGIYSEIIFHDVVSVETKDSVNAIWNTPCLFDPSKTYFEYIKSTKGLMRFKESVQSYQQTVDEAGNLSSNRTNPGGHGFIAVESLCAAYLKNELPDNDHKHLIGVVGNGEDLGSTPDSVIFGWMLKEQIPIVMITTDKTELDMKGGQISLVRDNDGVHVTIIEKAQAQNAGQLELFEKLGLRKQDKRSFFNTNVAVFNYEVLVPLIQKLVTEVGEQEFINIISPDLMQNAKKQKDKDGVIRTYVQLEGAMASSLLNLDKFWRKHYGKPIVHFVNVNKQNRTRFFSPVKTAFDFFIQFHSDRFVLDMDTMRLVDNRKGSLPLIEFKDEYYNDVKNVLECFNGVSSVDLDELYIEGLVSLNGFKLAGKVEIMNKSGKMINLCSVKEFASKKLSNVKKEL